MSPPLTEEQALALARYKINQKVTGLARIDTFNTLDPMRQEILVECAYQIGVVGLTKFKLMWAALAQHDFEEAARQMLDSKVAREQTPRRWQEHARRMRGETESEAAHLGRLAAEAAAEEAARAGRGAGGAGASRRGPAHHHRRRGHG